MGGVTRYYVSRYCFMGGYLEDLQCHRRWRDRTLLHFTFGELSTFVRGGLPARALARNSWWSNDRRHVQCLDGWDGAGLRVSHVDCPGRTVTFERHGQPRWTESDAWVLGAIRPGPRPLAEVIGCGDMINYAILGESEFIQAVPRLVNAGLIEADAAADRYALTPAGSSFCDRCMEGHGLFGWIDTFPAGLRRLGLPVDGTFRLEPGVFHAAYKEYDRGFQEAVKRSRHRRR
jgi:hypothetical protein